MSRRCCTRRLPILLLMAFVAASVTTVVVGHTPRQEQEQRGFLADQHHSHFSYPLSIHIGLFGFDGSGSARASLDSARLERELRQAMDVHAPAMQTLGLNTKDEEEDDESRVGVQVHLDYSVSHMARSMLSRLEDLIVKNAKLIATTEQGVLIYDIEAQSIESELDAFYHGQFPETSHSGSGHSEHDAGHHESHRALVILVANPDKVRMDPTKQGRPYVYRYRYAGGAPTQQWLSREGYLFVDLSAGPCSYGSSDASSSSAGEGTVTIGSVPLVAVKEFDPNGQQPNQVTTKFLSSLQSFLLSSIRHLFIPDSRWRLLRSAEKLLVPLVVFRNHRRFHPLKHASSNTNPLPSDHDAPFRIDLDGVRQAIKSMLFPSQELLFVHGAHHLHDHHHISMAVFKALRQDAVQTVGSEGVYSAQTRPYLDSGVLIDELMNASDEIIAAIMQAQMDSDSALNAADAELAASFAAAGVGGSSSPNTPPSISSTTAAAPGRRAAGHRVLPVFVLSLLGMPQGLLLDRKYMHVATPRCVLVLQTPHAATPVPFFSDGLGLVLDGRQISREIIAGVAESIGGINPPYIRVGTGQRHVEVNYLWAHGAIPWGPFSAPNSLPQLPSSVPTPTRSPTPTPVVTFSALFGDHSRRLHVSNRAVNALRIIRRSLKHVNQFQVRWGVDVNVTTTHTTQPSGGWMDGAADEESRSRAALVASVSERLKQQLEGMEQQFRQLSKMISEHQWSSANTLASSILLTARAFEKYVESEIESARSQLDCCHLTYVMPASSTSSSATTSLSKLFWMIVAVLTMAGIIFTLATFIRTRAPSTPVTYTRHSALLRPTLHGMAHKQRSW